MNTHTWSFDSVPITRSTQCKSQVMSLLLLAALGTVALHALWNVFRQYFITSPLDNLPGSRPSSLIYGRPCHLVPH